MTSYRVQNYFLEGIPQTALPGGLASRAIMGHWSAGRSGLEGAKATARDFVARPERNASYHELWYWHHLERLFGVLRIVPATRAAHSVNPQPPTWSPSPLVREILGEKVGDPNAVVYAVAFAGMPSDLVAAMKDPWFVECAARRVRELLIQETTITHPRPIITHGEGQPSTRYDWGDALRPAIYRELFAEENDDVPMQWRPVVQDWTTKTGPTSGAFFLDGPALGEKKWFTTPERVTTVAESADGLWRQVAFGGEILFMHRYNLTPIPDTRVPATGFGFTRIDQATREEVERLKELLDDSLGRIDRAKAALTA